MKRYFFHLRAPSGLSPDEVGIVLPDEADAMTEAVKAVRHIVRASPGKGAADWIGWSVQVVSEDKSVLSLPFDKVAFAIDLSEGTD